LKTQTDKGVPFQNLIRIAPPPVLEIGSILFLKNGLKKMHKKYKNNFKKNNYEVFTAIARCFSNILEDMVLEKINLFEDKIGRPPFCSNKADWDFCHQSL
jgi:hypothetical protein